MTHSHPDYQHLVGKDVAIKHYNKNNGVTAVYVGRCDFIGISSLHKQWQITIDRMPLWPIDPEKVQIILNRSQPTPFKFN